MLILVVDDDEGIRSSLTDMLEMAGFRAATAADGVQALEAVERERPALILLDLHLPRLDGVGVAKQLGGRIPIILMSADDGLGRAGREIEAVATVRKPYDVPRMLAEIRAALADAA